MHSQLHLHRIVRVGNVVGRIIAIDPSECSGVDVYTIATTDGVSTAYADQIDTASPTPTGRWGRCRR